VGIVAADLHTEGNHDATGRPAARRGRMHCTGLNTIIAVHGAMPKKLVMPSTGTRVIFGA